MLNRRNFFFGACCCSAVLSQVRAVASEKPYFEGETIKWIIPYRPGGGYDEYSRLIAPIFEKHTGARVDLLNLPGGGGMRGAAEIFRAPADGLHIGLLNGGGLLASSLGGTAPDGWDFASYSFVGRVSSEPRVMIVNAKGPFADFDSLRSADRSVVAGATGLGGSTYVDSVIAGRILDLKQKVVHGFDNSADIRLALLRGDVDCMWGSLGSAYDGLVAGDFRAILTVTPMHAPVLSAAVHIEAAADGGLNDPLKRSLFDAWRSLSEIGRPVAGPPDLPADRLLLLRQALAQTLADPSLIEAAQKANRLISPLPGEQTAEIAQRFASVDAETRNLIAAAVQGQI